METRISFHHASLFALLGWLLCMSVQARPLSVIAPTNPTAEDVIRIQYAISTGDSPALLASTAALNGKTIDISVVFSNIGFSVGYLHVNQVEVPPLPAGTYLVRLLISRGSSEIVHGEPKVIDTMELVVLPAGLPFSDLRILPDPAVPTYFLPLALTMKWNDCGVREKPIVQVDDSNVSFVRVEQSYSPSPCTGSQRPPPLIVRLRNVPGENVLTFVAKPKGATEFFPVQIRFTVADWRHAYTGAWYDPAQSGHGLLLEVLPGDVLYANWFAFAPDGSQQVWFGSTGPIVGSAARVSAVMAAGGRFPPNFDPSKIRRLPWGDLRFDFLDCNHIRLTYESSVLGYGLDTINLTRLTQPAGISCPQ